MYNVHSYAFPFLLLCFYSIQPVYKYTVLTFYTFDVQRYVILIFETIL